MPKRQQNKKKFSIRDSLTPQQKRKYRTLSDSELEQLGFGGWLGDNVAPLLQTAAGATLIATGAGTAAGVPMITSGVGQMAENALVDDPDPQGQALAQQRMQATRQNQMGQLAPQQSYTPTFKYGGQMKKKYNMGGQFEEYTGQEHTGPDEGIPIDKTGSPSTQTGGQAVALTEDGEVRWNDYVFSNELKLPGNKKRTFADEAKRLKNKYKKRLGDKVDKHDPISQDALEEELDELMMIQETIKGETVHREDAEQMMQEQAIQQQGMEQGAPQQQMDPSMQQQGMPMEGGMPPGGQAPTQQGQPMMNKGGRLPKYSGLDIDTSFLNTKSTQHGTSRPIFTGQNTPLGPTQSTAFSAEDVNFNLDPKTQAMMTHGYNTGTLQNQPRSLGLANTETGTTGQTGQEMVPMTGEISPIPAAISAGMSLYGLATDTDPAKHTRMPRIRPQSLDLSEARRGIRQQATQTRAGHSANLQQSGATGAQYQQGSLAGQVGSQRAAGQQLADLNLQQQQFEAQERGRTDQYNAQMLAQERMDKSEQQRLADERKRQYISGIGATASQYATDSRKSQDYAQMLNMMSDDHTLMRPKQRSVRDRLTGRERLTKVFQHGRR